MQGHVSPTTTKYLVDDHALAVVEVVALRRVVEGALAPRGVERGALGLGQEVHLEPVVELAALWFGVWG